jgi:hypothetical protein
VTKDQATYLAVSPNVLHETIDGEVIVIDLGTGSYYSLRGSAADVWQLAHQFPGITEAELIHAFASTDESVRPAIEASVPSLIGQLRDEGLFIASSDTPVLRASSPLNGNGVPRTFSRPLVEKYTDMQDLVLLDPVHEVGKAGWPAPPPEAEGRR